MSRPALSRHQRRALIAWCEAMAAARRAPTLTLIPDDGMGQRYQSLLSQAEEAIRDACAIPALPKVAAYMAPSTWESMKKEIGEALGPPGLAAIEVRLSAAMPHGEVRLAPAAHSTPAQRSFMEEIRRLGESTEVLVSKPAGSSLVASLDWGPSATKETT